METGCINRQFTHCVLCCFNLAVSSSRQARLEPKCRSKTYLSVSLCHLSTDAAVIYGYVSRGEQNFKISPKKQQEIVPPPLFPIVRGLIWKTPPSERRFAMRLLACMQAFQRREIAARFASLESLHAGYATFCR